MAVHISGIIYTILYIVLCKIFLETFADKRAESNVRDRTALLIVLIAADYVLSVVLSEHMVLKVVSVLILGTCVMWRVFRKKIWQIAILMVLYQGLCFTTDYISLVLLNHLFVDTEQERLFSPTAELFMGVFSQILLFCGLLAIKRFFRGRNSENLDSDLLTKSEWIRISVFPVFSIVYVIMILLYFDTSANTGQQSVLLCFAFGMLVMNILVFYLIHDILHREMKLRETAVFQKRLESELTMYHQISDQYNRQRKREHEYKNKMMVIESLVREGKIEKLEDYICKWERQPENRLGFFDTNHVIINAILNTKYQEAREKDITFVLKVNDLSDICIDEEDVVIILSNLLNNAIEACEQCEKKVIKIKFMKENGQIVISVMNTYGKQPVISGGEYQTTKGDSVVHGIGIQNIKETVSKYNGSCIIKHDGQMFRFVILISAMKF